MAAILKMLSLRSHDGRSARISFSVHQSAEAHSFCEGLFWFTPRQSLVHTERGSSSSSFWIWDIYAGSSQVRRFATQGPCILVLRSRTEKPRQSCLWLGNSELVNGSISE